MHFTLTQPIATPSTGKKTSLQDLKAWLFFSHYFEVLNCFRFPSKEDVLNFVVSVTKNYMKKQSNTLVIVGAYSIGKECVYLAISKALGVCWVIYFSFQKNLILRILFVFGS